jgi:2-octaprenyl-6-methoxyphenol hydroxylase
MTRVDVAIVGAGPVGAVLAALLARTGRRVRVLEARSAPSRDGRTLALSQASRECLEAAGGWPATGTTPIVDIHVSQKGGPGRTVISAADAGLEALGYTVSYATLEEALERRLADLGATVSWGAACESIDVSAERAAVRLADGTTIEAGLLVLADGGANARRIPGLAYAEKDYGQVAVTGPVRTDRPHRGRAYERFTPSGPVALLPVGERYALVWTAAPEAAARLVALDDASFLAALQAHFGDRAGRFVEAGARLSFPLRLRTINTPIARRTVVAGNAAQAMHPIAGQGLNIGLRDAASLAALLAADPAADPGGEALLEAYRRSRRRDAGRGVAFTDFLVGAFMDGHRTVRWGRGLALSALDLLPPARRWLAGRMISGAPSP